MWEASKAYIRGKIIAQTSKRKKEHKDSIRRMETELAENTGKSRGTDGFPREYYKEYVNIITPTLTNVFQEVFRNGSRPPSLNEALISLKPIFRPISPINVDNKILANVLALVPETILPYIIRTDQVSFIKGGSSTDHTRRNQKKFR